MNKESQQDKTAPREKGVHIPLPFDEAVAGLLRVKPPKKAAGETPPEPKVGAKKPAAGKKAPGKLPATGENARRKKK